MTVDTRPGSGRAESPGPVTIRQVHFADATAIAGLLYKLIPAFRARIHPGGLRGNGEECG